MTHQRSMEPSIFDRFEGFDHETRLKVIKAIADCCPEPEKNSDNPEKEMAELIVGNAAYQILNRELDYLAADMGVELDSKLNQLQALQALTEAVDGNRRRARLP